jgi:hypothetical protein
MRIPVIQGVIDRRMLVNFRVRPEALPSVLPAPFRPKLVRGWGMAGICLIRLKQIRPKHLPAVIGLDSENAAHRIAVEWDLDGKSREGVYIVRRDSSSIINTLAGGRLFPGVHHRARFDVHESERDFHLDLNSDDGQVHVVVDASVAGALPETSIFGSLAEASSFFEGGSVGYSPGKDENRLDGLELRSFGWKVEALDVKRAESSFFADQNRFPPGTVEFDCALLMRGIQHEWHDCGQLSTTASAAQEA